MVRLDRYILDYCVDNIYSTNSTKTFQFKLCFLAMHLENIYHNIINVQF